MAYVQKNIPWVHRRYSSLNKKELQDTILKYFKENLSGKIFINKCLGHSVLIANKSARKIAHGGALYPDKAELIRIIPEIIQESVYNNWGDRKISDSSIVKGYYNFKCKVRIDGELKHLRIAIQVRTNGTLYWNHEVNIVK